MLLSCAVVVVVVVGTALPAVSPTCQAKLNLWCHANCPIWEPSFHNPHPGVTCPGNLTALNSTGSPLYDPEKEWRCYSNSGLDGAHTHYVNGSCYCSRAKDLLVELCRCLNPTNPTTKCGPAPPPAPPYIPPPPPPPPNPPAPGVLIFHGGEAPGYGWYFFPRLLLTPTKPVSVFSCIHFVSYELEDTAGHLIFTVADTCNIDAFTHYAFYRPSCWFSLRHTRLASPPATEVPSTL
jgi:hypothetical protein